MLGRLRMSVDDVIRAYAKMARQIFSETKWWWKEGRYKASRLEKAINVTVGENTPRDAQTTDSFPVTERERKRQNVAFGSSQMMTDPHVGGDFCPVFVCAVSAEDVKIEPLLRTYSVIAKALPNCSIWQAARATSAAPSFFKPAMITDVVGPWRFVDGGLGYNNPTKKLLQEVAEQFPDRKVACVLSLGTGQGNVIRVRAAEGIPKPYLWKMRKTLQQIATDCEDTHAKLSGRFQTRTNVYFRFNVDQGLQGVGLEEWKKHGRVQAHTMAYTQMHAIDRKIDAMVEAIVKRRGAITIQQAAGLQ
ncbi:hypothetical protein FRC07_005926 [Ceratobasidium sp. 392]|nr:hypothetical protein FRC07_005926 [Ceratobasidium sp. 392]